MRVQLAEIGRRTCRQTTDYPRAAYAGVHDRNDISQLAFKSRVEVCAALDGSEAVAVGQLGEDSDVAAVLELNAYISGGKRVCRSVPGIVYVRVAMVGGGARRKRVKVLGGERGGVLRRGG